MTTRSKGNALERKAQLQLEAQGYLVERARPQIVWIGPGRPITKRVDLFGCFDLLALKAVPLELRVIQVCADVGGHAAERRRKIEQFAQQSGADRTEARTLTLELWRHRGGRARKADRLKRGFIVETYSCGEWTSNEE